jgi:hypothetical protein
MVKRKSVALLFCHTSYDVCALHAGYLKLQIHKEVVSYLSLFSCNHDCRKAPQYHIACLIIRKFSTTFYLQNYVALS